MAGHIKSTEREKSTTNITVTGNAATDIYVIKTPRGDAMVPVVREFVKRVDETGIYLLPIEGMFEA